MKKKISILHLDDNRSDSDMIKRELDNSNISFELFLVLNEKGFEKALSEFDPDIILADYSLPAFNGVAAFNIKQKKHSDIPFIIVTGTLGEEKAVELIKSGVTDYVLKDKLFTLSPKITRALEDVSILKEKRKVEQQLEFDKNNLDALINNTKDLMWSVDKDFSLITSNKAFDDMCRHSFGSIIEKGSNVLSESFYPEMSDRFKKLYERALAGETFTETDYFDAPLEMWSEISYSPIRKGDLVIGTACLSRDITKSKIIERNLIKSEVRLKEAQTISHISNWEIDLITNTNTWSDEFYTILGITQGEVQPSPEAFLSFIHPDDFISTKKRIEDTFLTFKEGSFEVQIKRKNGEIRQVFSEWKFELNKKNKPIRLFGIMKDVTERKNAEVERETMIANIIQHSKNLEQFASIVSHNLRAPVANILGISNILKNDISEEDKDRSMEFLFSATNTLDEILKDLNNILQMRDAIGEYKESVDFNELTDIIKLSIHDLIEKETVQIMTDFSAINKTVSIKSFMHSIFYNLISNSIKYRQPELSPLIRIKSELAKEKIRISFKDNGIGIDLLKYNDKVFGLYQRFHPHMEGKGLGLFMVKTQLETLGGTINIKSKPGEGTEFIIEFPIN